MKIMKVAMLMVMMIVMSEGTIIEQTCKKTPDYKLCVFLLNSDPRGFSADISGLAHILVDKIKGQAMNVINEMNGQYEKRPELSPVLKECSKRYRMIINYYLTNASLAVQLKNSADANGAVNNVDQEVSSCEKEFQGKSPLTSLTETMHKICSLTTTVTMML